MGSETKVVGAEGVPTALDVEAINKAFPEIQPGQLIPYEEIEKVIGQPMGSFRFRTVTSAWRRRLLRKGIEISSVLNTGFRRLPEAERTESGVRRFRSGARQIGKGVRNLEEVDVARLSDAEKKSHDHAVRVIRPVYDSLRAASREISVPDVKALPRVPPKES